MSIYQQHNPGQGDGMYLSLKDGDKVKMRIASDPAVTTFDGRKLRYNWLVWNRDQDKAQVYSAGVSVFSQIADLVEEWGEPTEFDISVKRTGSGQFDTAYSVTPIRTSDDLTKEQLAKVKEMDLPELCKGRWLGDYLKDGKMPTTLEKNAPAPSIDASDPGPSEEDQADDEISLEDIPFN